MVKDRTQQPRVIQLILTKENELNKTKTLTQTGELNIAYYNISVYAITLCSTILYNALIIICKLVRLVLLTLSSRLI